MKTRIISGAILVTLLVGLLFLSAKWSAVMYIASAVLSAIGVYEALYATGIAKNKIITAVGSGFSALFILRPILAEIIATDFLRIINITDSTYLITIFCLIQFNSYK